MQPSLNRLVLSHDSRDTIGLSRLTLPFANLVTPFGTFPLDPERFCIYTLDICRMIPTYNTHKYIKKAAPKYIHHASPWPSYGLFPNIKTSSISNRKITITLCNGHITRHSAIK
eukprot:868903_1